LKVSFLKVFNDNNIFYRKINFLKSFSGFILELTTVKICIKTVPGQKFFMLSLLYNITVIHHQYKIDIACGAQTGNLRYF